MADINTESKKYIIYTNATENSLIQLIKETNKLYESFYSVNDYYVLSEIIKILKNGNSIEDIQNRLPEVLNSFTNDSDQVQDITLWDPERINQLSQENSEYQLWINQLSDLVGANYSDDENLSDVKNFDRYDRNQLTIIDTRVNQAITKINNECGDFDSKIENNLSKINSIVEKSLYFAEKYATQVEDIQSPDKKHYSVYEEDVKQLMDDITLTVDCKNISTPTTPKEVDQYTIIVGYKDLPENRLNRYVQELNDLYSQLYNEDIYESQYVYVSLLNELVNTYESGADKFSKLGEIKASNNLYSQSSESVKSLVDELLESNTQIYDNEYVYSETDKSTISSLVSQANRKLSNVKNSNAKVQMDIDSYTEKIASAQEEYSQDHDGEQYPLEEIDTTPKKESTYEYVTPSSDIYSKSLPVINEIILKDVEGNDISEITLEEDGQTLEIHLSYKPESHKSIQTITVESQDSEIVNIDEFDSSIIKMTSKNIGETNISINVDGVQLEIPVSIIAKPMEYYVYFGSENPVLNNQQLNVELNGIETHYQMSEIITNDNSSRKIDDQYLNYIVLPLEWFRYTQIYNSLNMPIERSHFNKLITYDDVQYVMADLTEDPLEFSAENPYLYIKELSTPIDPVIIPDDEPEPQQFTWYLGETEQESFTTDDFNQTGTKPTTLNIGASSDNTVTVWIYPQSWGKPTKILDPNGNDMTNGFLYGDDWMTVPQDYYGAWIQIPVAGTITLTW